MEMGGDLSGRTTAFRLVAVSLFVIVGGCAATPGIVEVASFGEATTNAVSVIGETSQLEDDLALAYATELNACRYLRSQSYVVAPLRTDPPQRHLAEQAAFLKALSNYATALSKATDPNAIAKLKAAANQLTTSAAKLLTAASAAAPGAAIIAPIFKASVDVGIFISERQKMHEIQKIAADVQPLLLDATFLILNDDDKDRDILRKRLRSWETAARCSLQHIRPSSGEAYQQFVSLDKAKREFMAREEIANRRVTAITKVQAAHAILAKGNADLDGATDDINVFLDDIAGLKTAIDEERASP